MTCESQNAIDDSRLSLLIFSSVTLALSSVMLKPSLILGFFLVQPMLQKLIFGFQTTALNEFLYMSDVLGIDYHLRLILFLGTCPFDVVILDARILT